MSFPEALGQLLEKEEYRKLVEKDPAQLLKDYPLLSMSDLALLTSTWQACLGVYQAGDTPVEAGSEGYCCCCCSG